MSDSGRWVGRLSHTRGLAAANERSPRPVMVRCTRHMSMSDKCSCRCPVTDTSTLVATTDLYCDRNYTHSHTSPHISFPFLHVPVQFFFHCHPSPQNFYFIPNRSRKNYIPSPPISAKLLIYY